MNKPPIGNIKRPIMTNKQIEAMTDGETNGVDFKQTNKQHGNITHLYKHKNAKN